MIFPRKQVDAISVLSLQQTDPRGRTPLVFPSLVVCMPQCNLVLCGIKVGIPSSDQPSFRVMLFTGLRGGTQQDPFILFMSCVFTGEDGFLFLEERTEWYASHGSDILTGKHGLRASPAR